jgi:hypothetical protein
VWGLLWGCYFTTMRKVPSRPERWALLGRQDMTFAAQDALAYGFVDEIAEFAPPFGAKVFNI